MPPMSGANGSVGYPLNISMARPTAISNNSTPAPRSAIPVQPAILHPPLFPLRRRAAA